MRVLPLISHPGPPFVNPSKVREQLGDPEQDKEAEWGGGLQGEGRDNQIPLTQGQSASAQALLPAPVRHTCSLREGGGLMGNRNRESMSLIPRPAWGTSTWVNGN